MSDFLERVFDEYSRLTQKPVLLNKGQYYQLVKYLPPSEFDPEITEKLDLIVKILS